LVLATQKLDGPARRGTVLIRSWNLFHGRTSPAGRGQHLEEMLRLASADRPDVLVLQEIPVWALERLAGWSGMAAVSDVARPPTFGPVPISVGLGRRLTSLRLGLFRSAFSGQGNAILLAGGLHVVAHEVVVLNPGGFRRKQAAVLGLGPVVRLAWAKERRICQVVRLEQGVVVANLHASGSLGDPRVPAAELRRAATFAERLARVGDIVVIAGDFNVAGHAAALDGYSAPGPWIDHIEVRGRVPSALRTWPDERRLRDGMLLSDHAPVELDL
jgi:endonuclease/exonuclease/phosphatase family metal-dependent hydrolase